mgnify:CR=1 FL=1
MVNAGGLHPAGTAITAAQLPGVNMAHLATMDLPGITGADLTALAAAYVEPAFAAVPGRTLPQRKEAFRNFLMGLA